MSAKNPQFDGPEGRITRHDAAALGEALLWVGLIAALVAIISLFVVADQDQAQEQGARGQLQQQPWPDK